MGNFRFLKRNKENLSFEIDEVKKKEIDKNLKNEPLNKIHFKGKIEFKNVYYLGARNINPDGLNLEITYKNGSLGNNVRDEKSGKTFLNLFGLDSLDANGNLSPDDLIDKMNHE